VFHTARTVQNADDINHQTAAQTYSKVFHHAHIKSTSLTFSHSFAARSIEFAV
jgi:hypothetical protein